VCLLRSALWGKCASGDRRLRLCVLGFQRWISETERKIEGRTERNIQTQETTPSVALIIIIIITLFIPFAYCSEIRQNNIKTLGMKKDNKATGCTNS